MPLRQISTDTASLCNELTTLSDPLVSILSTLKTRVSSLDSGPYTNKAIVPIITVSIVSKHNAPEVRTFSGHRVLYEAKSGKITTSMLRYCYFHRHSLCRKKQEIP